jgi:glycosyltransferase involved in cell wall biosynthesis
LELRQALIASPELHDAVLLVFGESKGPFSDLPQKVVTAGFSSEESVLAQVYGASDVFAMPSLEEAFGQTALEAMACGIPVVGFRTGGIPDTVNHEVTGLLGPVGDVPELGKMLTRIRNHPEERFRMGEASRARVEKHFTLERQRQDYLQIYEQALQKISHD